MTDEERDFTIQLLRELIDRIEKGAITPLSVKHTNDTQLINANDIYLSRIPNGIHSFEIIYRDSK